MESFELNFEAKSVIDFELDEEGKIAVFAIEKRKSSFKNSIRVISLTEFYQPDHHKFIEKDVTYRPIFISLCPTCSENQQLGVLSVESLFHLYCIESSSITQVSVVGLACTSPIVDFFFTKKNEFFILCADEKVSLCEFEKSSSGLKMRIKNNFFEEKDYYSSFYFNYRYLLLCTETKYLLFSFNHLSKNFIFLDCFILSPKKINLFSFLENNSWFQKQLALADGKNTDDKKTKRKSKVNSFDLIIDETLQEKFTSSKQDKKNKFEFIENIFLVLISKNEYTLELLDLSSKTKHQLNICFKGLFVLLSPFLYKKSSNSPVFHLVLIFGFKEMLGLLFCLEETEKIFNSVIFVNDFEYCVEKVRFIDPFRIAFQNEMGRLNVFSFQKDHLGPLYFAR